MRRSLGGDFREARGLTRNPNAGNSPLADLPEWSYMDGRPGIPTWVLTCHVDYWHHPTASVRNFIAHFTLRFADLGKRVSGRQEALDIKTALDMIRDSQRSLYEAAEAEKAAESASQSQRVKPKGNRLFSDLLWNVLVFQIYLPFIVDHRTLGRAPEPTLPWNLPDPDPTVYSIGPSGLLDFFIKRCLDWSPFSEHCLPSKLSVKPHRKAI